MTGIPTLQKISKQKGCESYWQHKNNKIVGPERAERIRLWRFWENYQFGVTITGSDETRSPDFYKSE